MTAPDFMPILAWGGHETPESGACAMEYASVLAGEPFSDHPTCTLELLAQAMRNANDDMEDEDRQKLLPLIPRVIDTNPYTWQAQNRVTEGLIDWMRRTYPVWAGQADQMGYDPAHSAVLIFDSLFYDPEGTSDGDDGADAGIAFLTALIDEYDRLTGTVAAPSGLTPEAIDKLRTVFA